MRQFGLKLWSINKNYRDIAIKLYEDGLYDFIELYAIPDSYDDTISHWQALDIPFIIHAPHFMQGVNFSIKEKYDENFRTIKDSFRFADKLNAKYIIFHPGIGGSYIETGRQMAEIKDARTLVENKPYNVSLKSRNSIATCVGAKYEEIEYIVNTASVNLCLDIGHLFSACNAIKLDKFQELERFNKLNPKLYHLSDGDIDGSIDKHLHFTEGSYPLNEILKRLIKDTPLTIETDKNFQDSLDDFADDIRTLKKIEATIS